MSQIFKEAYNWALTHTFEELEIEYASKLALKMLDDSCQMTSFEREIFFNVYDAICDRRDIELDDDVNHLIKTARNRTTIYSKPELASIVHACRLEIIPNMLKVHMKAYKSMVRKNLDI